MYLAFLLRDQPISGVDGALAAGAVIAAAGIGNSLGTLLGSLLKARKPEAVVLVVLLADATVAVAVAVLYGLPILIALGLVAGLCSALGKLSLDAMIQRDVPESVRTSVFARSETVLQLAWVIGGGCGIVLPLIPRLGFGFLAAVLLVVVFLVLRFRPAPAPPLRAPRPREPRAPRPDADGPTRRSETAAEETTSTSRTILSVAEQRANRAQRSTSHDEPTIEWNAETDQPDPSGTTPFEPTRPAGQGPLPGPIRGGEPARGAGSGRGAEAGRGGGPERPGRPGVAPPEQPVGRWWSGQQDEDDDPTEDQPTWAEEPTVERNRKILRRRPGGDPRHPPR
jgi:hypothetical protein